MYLKNIAEKEITDDKKPKAKKKVTRKQKTLAKKKAPAKRKTPVVRKAEGVTTRSVLAMMTRKYKG